MCNSGISRETIYRPANPNISLQKLLKGSDDEPEVLKESETRQVAV